LKHQINGSIVKWTRSQDVCVKLNIDGRCGASSYIGNKLG